uniref:Ig-like domain-containing protein n=1 Tax=Equus asinus TaxID=9793 RepID=A0A9L0IL86_EQUAS
MRSVTGITILLTFGIVGDAKTIQPNAMESTEKEPVHLPCNHSTISGSEYIYWYRQIPYQGPEYVIHGLKSTETNGMASLIIATDRKSSTLILSQVTLRDTAVYYCIDAQWCRQGISLSLVGKGDNLYLKRTLHRRYKLNGRRWKKI